ncbi:hypothetical protein NZD88_05680 [Chryseobacterium antibioticum]|uniref:Uncharacterized protein n=1 Tax=Chryseobacterium pyrolae TaxID=2987481 RepID=A0ABT2IEK0_9FLAO|nr:hypothetical protein [Chryseobacterium pyrolae]MCT2407044.1 hypothetical protein [Chryseobacterium pyrolae]
MVSIIVQLNHTIEQISKTLLKKFQRMFRIEKIIIRGFSLDLTGGPLHAQISPPGLGDANAAFWSAFGVRRQLDCLGKKQALSYIALGHKSSLKLNKILALLSGFVWKTGESLPAI